MKERIYVGLLAMLLAPALVAAQAQQHPALGAERSRPAAKISEEQAKKIALEQVPGKVTDVTIERKLGKQVYVVEIQTPNEGEKDVFVDIVTGQIVGTE